MAIKDLGKSSTSLQTYEAVADLVVRDTMISLISSQFFSIQWSEGDCPVHGKKYAPMRKSLLSRMN